MRLTVCKCSMHVQCLHGTEGCVQSFGTWNWHYGGLSGVLRVLGTKPGLCRSRASSTTAALQPLILAFTFEALLLSHAFSLSCFIFLLFYEAGFFFSASLALNSGLHCLSFLGAAITGPHGYARIVLVFTFQFRSISQPGDSYIRKDPIKKDIYLV